MSFKSISLQSSLYVAKQLKFYSSQIKSKRSTLNAYINYSKTKSYLRLHNSYNNDN